MKSCLICEVGIIGEDGRLRIPPERLTEFYRQHAGERAIVKIEALERHSTPAMFRYYFGYVLPTARRGMLKQGNEMTEAQVHEFLWGEFPGEHDRLQDIRQAPQSQVLHYMEWLKRYAAENLETYIEDPNSL